MKDIIFYGDEILVYNFPEQIGIFSALKNLLPLEDKKAVIRKALENPLRLKRLEKLIDMNL